MTKKAESKIDGRKAVNTREAAEFIGIVSEYTLRKYRMKSKAIGKLIGPVWVECEGSIGYRIVDLEEYLESCVTEVA